jgi:2-dehydropantoate 2-reductase
MHTTIIGTGGVGGYFGGKMADAGLDVTFVARGSHAEAMRKKGLQVKSFLGDFHVKEVKVVETITQVKKTDLVLVAVKAWQIKEVRDEINQIIHSESIVIPLQNGILAVDELAEVIERKRIVSGLCRIISKIEAPGIINHFGVSPIIVFGEQDKTDSSRLHQVKAIFDKAGFDNEISMDMDAELWKKFIVICLSGLLAVTNTTYGEMREIPETRQMMVDVLNEIYQISQRMKINVSPGFVDQAVAFIDSFPYNTTSSLTRDVWEKKPSEIDYQNGTVVKLSEKYGIPAPVNQFIYNCILPGEMRARKG